MLPLPELSRLVNKFFAMDSETLEGRPAKNSASLTFPSPFVSNELNVLSVVVDVDVSVEELVAVELDVPEAELSAGGGPGGGPPGGGPGGGPPAPPGPPLAC